MNTIQSILLLLSLIGFISCNDNPEVKTYKGIKREETRLEDNKIKVLNFGTFHMGFTTDANTVEFDEHSQKNKDAVQQIAQKLSAFNPTVIIVETAPKYNDSLQKEYSAYLKNPDRIFENPSEIELLAYELGRLCQTTRIYGIDHKMEYNYQIGEQIINSIDSVTYKDYVESPFRTTPELNVNKDSLSLLGKLKLTNNEKYLDFLIAINADILTHVGTEDNFEGADEAANYYQRNLRMYANFNRIPLEKKDRVFILMGASHTAFFRDFISRSPKYEMVSTFDYLK